MAEIKINLRGLTDNQALDIACLLKNLCENSEYEGEALISVPYPIPNE